MSSDATPLPPPAFGRALRFGRFWLDPARKVLLDDGRAVRVGSRALDLLIALVERAGDVVSHDDLFARVWPHTVVEESSLRVHMSALRKVLGDGLDGVRYIASLPGRGYSFVMDVTETRIAPEPDRVPPAVVVPEVTAVSLPPLPARLTGIVGREQVLAALSAKLRESRLVTIVGTGGIGKTTVALALADMAAGRHAGSVCFVDLASLDDPALVPGALAAAIGIAAPEPSPWTTLEAALASRELLVVLDNCEHLVLAATELVERVLRVAPRVHVLATSREPLDAESEAVHRLEALAVPPAGQPLSVDDALAFPALRLFVERATAGADDFQLSPANLVATVRICRHLDGVPLAIELAAARVGSLGIHALAERLDDVFRLLRLGRRTVLPRHQTLQALLDWSHALLHDDQRTVLHRLSAFRASFTLETAVDLATCARVPPAQVIACVLDLVSRSLVELEPGATPRYRLLFVTRLYAWEHLVRDGETDAVGRRHALCLRNALARANAELGEQRMSQEAWRAAHASAMADVHAALDWAQGPGDDPMLAAELVVESCRLQMEIGLNDELLLRTLDALAALRAREAVPPELELRLLSVLCQTDSQSLVSRRASPDAPARLDRLAQCAGTPLQRRVARFALCAHAFGHGDYPATLERANGFLRQLFETPAAATASAAATGWRFEALGRHYLGDHRAAWEACARVIEHAERRLDGTHSLAPLPVSIGIVQARILWLQGYADQALERALVTLRACEGSYALALDQALSLGILPILLWRGDDALARSFVERLVDHDLAHCQSFWLAWSHAYCRVLALRGHDMEPARQRLGDTERMTAMIADLRATLDPQFVGPDELARVEGGLVGWCAPEVLRVHGERLGSEEILQRALALAREQGARAWELRVATSLGSLWHSMGRCHAARDLLADVLAGFTEGRGCIDVRRAQALLVDWDAVS